MIDIDKIYNEDCLEGMKRIADGAVDCIITDLPYGTTACAWDSVIPFEPLWEQFKRVTKPNAAIVLFGSEPFSSALRMSNIKEYKYDWIWVKSRPIGHLNAKEQPMRKSENISVFYQSQPTYNPQGLIKGVFNNNRPCKSIAKNGKHFTGEEHEIGLSEYTNYPHNMLEYPNPSNGSLHPTQKPVDLLRYLILTYSNEGDTILDATIGSGTTAVAALMEKRHFIGFETNKEYFDIAVKRIALEQSQPALF